MKITSAEFVCSNVTLDKLPKPDKPEYAFIGRSNVGKSSLINLLTTRKGLAKVSTKPGKTQVINHFIINSTWYLVDLPGYGYAKVSKEKREQFEGIITEYLTGRPNLKSIFVLIDIRLEPQQIDLEFMDWLAEHELPFVMLFTKSDKLKLHELNRNIQIYRNKLVKIWEDVPIAIVTSSVTGRGKDDILNLIAGINLEK